MMICHGGLWYYEWTLIMLFIIITYDLLPIKRQIIVHSNPLIEPVYTPNYYVVEPMLPSPRPIATATLPEK